MRVTDLLVTDGPHLCKEMLVSGPVTVQIDKVVGNVMVPRPGSSQKEKRHTLAFIGKEKTLVLNSTNRRFLVRVLGGKDTREWHGKTITLYFDPTPRNPDGSNGGIRIAYGEQYSGAVPPPKPKRAATKSNPRPEPAHDPETGEVGDDADLDAADDFDRGA